MPKNFNLKKAKAIEHIRERNLSDTKIARKTGLSQPTISKLRKSLGFMPVITVFQHPKNQGNQQITDRQRALVIGLLTRGNFSHNRIARRVGVSADTVHWWAKKINALIHARQISKFRINRIINLLKHGESIVKTAKLTGVSLITVGIISAQEKRMLK